MCHFFVIDKARSALERFKEGLVTLEVLTVINKYPNLLLRAYFCHSPQIITADMVDGRRQDREELMVMHWRDYLQDCQGTVNSEG